MPDSAVKFDPNLVWLIQKNQNDRLAVLRIQDILDSVCVRWIELEIDLRSLELPPVEAIHQESIVLCHGPAFIRRFEYIAPILRGGCIFDPDAFRWIQFRKHWDDLMLSVAGQVASAGELYQNIPTHAVFMRPDTDSKTFEGGVRSPAEATALLAKLNPDLPVVIAPAVSIEAEYRVFMVGSEVVAASEYRRNGKPSITGFVPGEIVDMALKVDNIWRPADAYVIDIALSDGRYGVVEANCIMASRFYGADPQAIIVALCRLRGRLK